MRDVKELRVTDLYRYNRGPSIEAMWTAEDILGQLLEYDRLAQEIGIESFPFMESCCASVDISGPFVYVYVRGPVSNQYVGRFMRERPWKGADEVLLELHRQNVGLMELQSTCNFIDLCHEIERQSVDLV